VSTENLRRKLVRAEPYFFVGLVFLNMIPFLSGNFFPFGDAPAHLYNSNVIHQMLFGNNEFLSEYISFNKVIVPNWFSHFLLAGLNLFFSMNVAEKILLVLYFAGLPLAFRYCLKVLNENNKHLSYLIFPFTYNALALIGFYNFSFSLVFMFLSIGFFLKEIAWGVPLTRHYLVLFVLLMLLYFCHPVGLCVTLLVIFSGYINYLWVINGASIKRWFSGKTFCMLVLATPFIFLLVLYIVALHSSTSGYLYYGQVNLSLGLIRGWVFGFPAEPNDFSGWPGTFTSWIISILLIVTFLACSYLLIRNFKNYLHKNKLIFIPVNLFLLCLLYMFFPEEDGNASFMSLRLALMVFLFGILFVATFSLDKTYITLVTVCILLAYCFSLKTVYAKYSENNIRVTQIQEQSAGMEQNSFLYYFYCNDFELGCHYYNYMCLDKSIVVLQNYQCDAQFFPLVWKDHGKMKSIQTNLENFENLEETKAELKNMPIYIYVLGNLAPKTDSGAVALKNNLTSNCVLLNASATGSLYKLK
jgi:hypothetical protein